jgi:hypothetical protein
VKKEDGEQFRLNLCCLLIICSTRYYNKLGKTYLFDIDFHHLRKDRDDWQSKYTVDAYHVGNVRVTNLNLDLKLNYFYHKKFTRFLVRELFIL